MNDDGSHIVSCRLSEVQFNRIRWYADARDVSISDVLRELVDQVPGIVVSGMKVGT